MVKKSKVISGLRVTKPPTKKRLAAKRCYSLLDKHSTDKKALC